MNKNAKERLIRDYNEIVCKQADKIDPNDHHVWESLFVGFALGRGFSPEEASDFELYQEAMKYEGV